MLKSLWVSGVAVCLLALIGPAVAAADSPGVATQQIKITAVVLPTIYVVVNRQNQIQEIISNTPDASIPPTVYLDVIKPETLQTLTPIIEKQASSLLQHRTLKPGVMYKRPPALQVAPVKSPLLGSLFGNWQTNRLNNVTQA